MINFFVQANDNLELEMKNLNISNENTLRREFFYLLLEPEFEQLKKLAKRRAEEIENVENFRFKHHGNTLESLPVQFGKYELQELIGRGGMGSVYLAVHKRTKKKVAVKIIGRDIATLPKNRELMIRFQREWKAISKVRHPNIIEIIDVGYVDGVPYYSMEFLQKKTLFELLRNGPLPFTNAAKTISSIAKGLAVVHYEGLVHRDISPHNIVDGEGEPKLLDFGLAKDIRQTCTIHTKTGAAMGTVCYMSPEQMKDSKAADFRSDIFSLGAVLYQSIVGVPPFSGHDVIETTHGVMNSNPVEPSAINPEVPRDLSTICLKCLEKNPSDRYSNASLLAEDLDRFLDGDLVLAKRPSVLKRSYSFWMRNQVFGFSLITVFAILSLCVGIMFYWNHDQREQNALVQIKSTNVAKLNWSNHKSYFVSQERILTEFQNEHKNNVKLKLSIVLGDHNQEIRDFFSRYVLECSFEELTFLLNKTSEVTWKGNLEHYWNVACNSNEKPRRRMRALAVLAKIDLDSEKWKLVESFLVQELLSRNIVEVTNWIELFDRALVKYVSRFSVETYDGLNDNGITVPIVILTKLVQYDSSIVKQLISNASPVQFRYLMKYLPKFNNRMSRHVIERISEIKRKPFLDRTNYDRSQLANGYLCLIILGNRDPGAIFDEVNDPTIEILIANRCLSYGVGLETLVQSLESSNRHQAVRQRLLLIACAYYHKNELSNRLKARLHNCANDCLNNSIDSGVHYTSKWMMEKWDMKLESPILLKGRHGQLLKKSSNWFTTESGHEMAVIRSEYRYLPPIEFRRLVYQPSAILELKGEFSPYCIGCKEVTWEQYEEFARGHGVKLPDGVSWEMPVVNRSFFEVATFCNWLTVQDGFGEKEQCFSLKDGKMLLVPDYKRRKGYRFATFYEHHNAVGEAGFLEKNNHMQRVSYGVGADSKRKILPPGCFQPNYFGLFDICGNSTEWSCGNGLPLYANRIRGSYGFNGQGITSPSYSVFPYAHGFSYGDAFEFRGIRLVRGISKKALE